MSIYKSCDIRGHFGEELKLEHAGRLGAAIADMVGQVEVLVAGDGRNSTPQLKQTLVDSLLANGCGVVDLGIGPTPLFYFARRLLGLNVGVMVTASHNPAWDNGFKVTLGSLPITVEEMGALAGKMETCTRPAQIRSGEYRSVDLSRAYLDFLFSFVPDLRGMRIVVDCAHGMAALFARSIWQRSGAEVILLYEAVDGGFPAHSPNPAAAENLTQLSQAVVEHQADLGVAYDGDADRVAFIDGSGKVLSNDQAIVLFAREMLKDGPEIVVYDQKCSRVVADEVHAVGGTAVRELSGHTFIKRTFLEHDAIYAGELSGHHFFRSVQGDDGLTASLIFAGLVHRSGLSLEHLAASVPAYPITPDVRLPMQPAEIQALLNDLEHNLAAKAKISRTDGLRIEFTHGWGLVRPSVTEPVVTMRFEGTDWEALTSILDMVEKASVRLTGKLTAISTMRRRG
jgi:phosphomannomutase/phosphoglucomutase